MTAKTVQLDRFLDRRPDPGESRALDGTIAIGPLLELAVALRDQGHGDLVT